VSFYDDNTYCDVCRRHHRGCWCWGEVNSADYQAPDVCGCGAALLNTTPHPVHVYPAGTADRIRDGEVEPLLVLPAFSTPVRAGEQTLACGDVLLAHAGVAHRIPVAVVRPGLGTLLPRRRGVWLVVSRPVAMSAPYRDDLIVIDREVRDHVGRTIGCRGFARLADLTQVPR
jgi:hypothetical protein